MKKNGRAARLPWVLVLLAGFGGLFASCASKSDVYKDIDAAVGKNAYEQGVAAIVKGQEGKKPIYPESNVISLYLDKGLLEHYAGNYADSSQDLQEAERLIEEAVTRSVSQDVASYIANDNTKEYSGEDFEDIYLNVFNALNYYNNGDIDGALVEIRKLTQSSGKINLLAQKYETAGPNVGEWLREQFEKMGITLNPVLPPGKPVDYTNSALVRYLSALFYRGEGKADDARIEFGQVQAAFTANPRIYSNSIPQSVADEQVIPAGKARLNIIGFAGLSPVKEEGLFYDDYSFLQDIPFDGVTPDVKAEIDKVLLQPDFKLPLMVKRTGRIDRIEVVIDGGEPFNLELLEDMGAVIEETFNAKFSNMLLKTYIRTLVKYAGAYTAAAEAGKQAAEKSAALGPAAAKSSAVAAKKAVDASEAADIRMSRYFPDKAYVGGVTLDPGTYTVVVNYYAGGKLLASDTHTDFEVQADALNLVESFNLK
jgi:hypothetical protein